MLYVELKRTGSCPPDGERRSYEVSTCPSHSPRLPSIDLRADRRYAVDVGGVLRIEGVPASVYVVTVLDVSKSGLRARCPISIPVGTGVTVTCCDAKISGEVRYVREQELDEFTVGIEATATGGIDLTLFLLPIARCI